MLNAIRRSLRSKIVIVVMLTTFVALIVAAASLLVYEVRTYSSFLLADAATQAELLADITAPALEFDDPAAAQANLDLLSKRREIVAGAVYMADGRLFARFARSADTKFPEVGPAGTTVSGRTLTTFQPIVKNEQVLGSVYLSSTYEIGGRIRDYVLILLGVVVPSFLVAVLMSFWLAGGVTNPLRNVTDVARHVVERRDFTRRAQRTTDDEIGVFVDAFNTMLVEVGRYSAQLEASNRALQQETEERRHAEVALRRADQLKDEFLATLAHELRNPLAPMVNAMQLLARPDIDRGIVQNCYELIGRQLHQLVRLVDDLLDVSRITSGKLALRNETLLLSTVIGNAVDTAKPLIDQRRQELSVELPSEPIHLRGDGVRLAQVFANVLNNAAKYSEPGKRITLDAARANGHVRVRVTDGGIGMDSKLLPSIFDMFTQGEAGRGMQGGLGVGLALARRLVELHGGTIVAESAGVGRGSTFTITFPTVDAGQDAPLPAVAGQHPSTRRILLVDDNVDFATSMALLLGGMGHEVRVAHNAADAVVVARELRPSLAFLDLGLPDTSGYELAQALRALPETARTVLVAVSGWGQPRDRERSREAGFALHLVKPVELRSMQAAIDALVTAERAP